MEDIDQILQDLRDGNIDLQQAQDIVEELHRQLLQVRQRKRALEGLVEALRAPQPSSNVRPSSPSTTRQRRLRRNQPCPCGSGKKFKKCCLGHQA